MLICAFCQVTAANGSSSSEVKTAEGESSDEPVKTTNGGSALGLQLTINGFASYFQSIKC